MPAGGLLTAGVIAAGAQTGMGIFQAFKGARQRKKAMQQLADNPYEIPSSVTRAVDLAGSQAQGTKMAGQERMEERLASTTASTVAGARRSSASPSQTLQSTMDAYLSQQRQQQEIDITAAQDYRTRQQNYINILPQLARYEEQKWKYNTLYPVQARLNQASETSAAGWQNIGTGIQSGMSMMGNQQYLSQLGGGAQGAIGGGYTPQGIGAIKTPTYQPQQLNIAGMQGQMNPWVAPNR